MLGFKKKEKLPEKNLGIYVHIPFCRSKCEYCDFCSSGMGRSDVMFDKYMNALKEHFLEGGRRATDHVVDTVYFGGGTPSYFGAARLASLLEELGKRFYITPDAEITFEGNPDSIDLKGLYQLKRAGFNRISIGVQNDNDDILKVLGRPHTFQQARDAVSNARTAGFDNVSIDLMYGLPSQTKAGWARCLKNALDMKPDHISAYGLKLEEGTPMYEYQDALIIPNDDTQADMYLYLVELMEENGFSQYEISNFAKAGKESRHNLKYWTLQEYMSFGPSAASDFGGRRYTYIADTNKYIKGVNEKGSIITECEDMPLRERAGEYIMLGLRTGRGIEEGEYKKTYLMPFDRIEELLLQYQEQDLATRCGDEDERWRLTPSGMLISNRIIGDIIEAQAEVAPQVRRY